MLSDYPLFDSHLHIIDRRFPLIPNNGFLPDAFSCDDYLARMADYHLVGGAVVSGSFQGFDQTYLLDALKTLGTGFVGVIQLPAETSEKEILHLNKAGVRAVRFNLYRGGSENINKLTEMAQRVYELAGWHVELYIDSMQLENLFDLLIRLPKISIDHFGLSKAGFNTLLRLVDKGVYVKASGFSRSDLNVADAIQAIHNANPSALMFGTDLPSTRAPVAYQDEDFKLVVDLLGEQVAKQVLCTNALRFYKLFSE